MVNLIGVSGKMGSGKDTVGKIIQEIDGTWEIKKYAYKLKQIASLLTGIPIEKFEDQSFKETELGEEWGTWIPYFIGSRSSILRKMTVRKFLQLLGTDAIRNGLHTNTWENALFADYKLQHFGIEYGTTESGERIPVKGFETYPKWVITDCRFPNEAEAVKKRGGVLVRIERETSTKNNDHPSETALDLWKFDQVIKNNGTLDQLKQEVETFYKKMINNELE